MLQWIPPSETNEHLAAVIKNPKYTYYVTIRTSHENFYNLKINRSQAVRIINARCYVVGTLDTDTKSVYIGD